MMRKLLGNGLIVGVLLVSAAVLLSDDKVQKRFEKSDTNNDGIVTAEEFKAAAANPQQGGKAFKRLDLNGDGSLTKAELRAAGLGADEPKSMPLKVGKKAAGKAKVVKPGPQIAAANTAPSAKITPTQKVAAAPNQESPKSAVIHDQRNSTRDPLSVAVAIDREINLELVKNKIPESPVANDSEFIRRLSLDLRGRIPSFTEIEKFLKETNREKRRLLIDEFLADDEYGEHFAIVWYHRISKPDDDNRRALQNNELQDWLAVGFNQNRGWDGIVNDLLTASGDREQNPATTFWLTAINDAKAGQPEPAKATAAATRLFMGIRLECCECHNHPFTPLKQTDFWGTAAFFAQTHAKGANQQAAKTDAKPNVFEQANFVMRKKKNESDDKGPPAPFGSVKIPYAEGKTVEVKYLGGPSPKINGETKLRPIFAAWLTSGENPYFARAA
ncbi:MAG: hypothetical protein JWM11_1503, partial [Planctomycetaceae bacterium]|nr:hypothetical protein [Planctomycetaceae bacterium]